MKPGAIGQPNLATIRCAIRIKHDPIFQMVTRKLVGSLLSAICIGFFVGTFAYSAELDGDTMIEFAFGTRDILYGNKAINAVARALFDRILPCFGVKADAVRLVKTYCAAVGR